MDPINTLLDDLAERGVTQAEVARAIGVSPQFLSDLKWGRRPLSELVARRISDEWEVDAAWLLGREVGPNAGGWPCPLREKSTWLPVFPHPIEGEPQDHPRWEGTFVPVPAMAAPKLVAATHPYVLRFRNNDVDGRLHKNDLVLVSQTPNESAQIVVVRTGKKCFLCRRKSGRWVRVASGQPITGDCVVIGHCIAVVWSALD